MKSKRYPADRTLAGRIETVREACHRAANALIMVRPHALDRMPEGVRRDCLAHVIENALAELDQANRAMAGVE